MGKVTLSFQNHGTAIDWGSQRISKKQYSMSSPAVSYLVFDIESIADGELISKVRYPGEGYSPEKAIEVYCAERMEQYGTEFIPYTFHIPVSVAIIKLRLIFESLTSSRSTRPRTDRTSSPNIFGMDGNSTRCRRLSVSTVAPSIFR